MPIKQSAVKKLRQDRKRQAHNVAIKNQVKKLVKAVRQQIAAKDKEKASTALQAAVKGLDKAVKNGVLKKNTVSRTKSRLAKAANLL